jgi:hypothetical protein
MLCLREEQLLLLDAKLLHDIMTCLGENTHQPTTQHNNATRCSVKGIVSPDWKGLQMVSLDRFEV